MLLLALFLLAHSWYPQDCCTENHCHPVPCSDLQREPYPSLRLKMWNYVPQGMRFPESLIRPSQDEQCHVCVNGTMMLCVFMPQPNMS